jgi:hypothetical protein
VTTPQKSCRRCEHTYPTSAFEQDRRQPDGFGELCKPCLMTIATKIKKPALPLYPWLLPDAEPDPLEDRRRLLRGRRKRWWR